ncbi:Hsp70 family protein, partial [Selenomonas noxia]|uniref:Hsp70 family protein n=1 Tax=Selenomonas noxia TaxID=135083 RepID=UPI0023F123D1
RMVKEAEAHAAEDKKQKEAVDARNAGDSLVYQAEKTIKDLGENADQALVGKTQAAVDKLKEALKGSDIEAIKAATEEARQPLYELSAAAYQQAQQAAGAAGAAPSEDAGAQSSAPQDDNVVDAEFTEVKDDEK